MPSRGMRWRRTRCLGGRLRRGLVSPASSRMRRRVVLPMSMPSRSLSNSLRWVWLAPVYRVRANSLRWPPRSPTRQRHARGAGRRRGASGSDPVRWRQPHPPRGTAGGAGRHSHRPDHPAAGLAGRWTEQSPAPPSTLLIAVDDATGQVVSALFCEHEDARSYFLLIRALVEHRGVPVALYTDRHAVFKHTPGPGLPAGPTQFNRAMDELGTQMIFAQSAPGQGTC